MTDSGFFISSLQLLNLTIPAKAGIQGLGRDYYTTKMK
jgi:hypothetical protein